LEAASGFEPLSRGFADAQGAPDQTDELDINPT